MKKIQFHVDIKAPREKVWDILWEDSSYRKWTSAFTEGSYAVSTWNEGDKILFMDPAGSGMYSMIEKMDAPELMSFKHLGVLKDGRELPTDDATTKSWSGAHEIYTLKETGGSTRLDVTMETEESHKEYFENTFPKALAIVKELAEKS
jgi:hypothetical protein